ncbi:peroxiredoxin-like family protein [Polycyclovorans algicola]|uniref:peroxiredoxin-like family protein n=1 Tax=Polycyclovorans algicola TaxID=616992 RepID=UPI0004A77157|nr:peroxiredoxin-like family protein [Polycyclovorans algicola]
MHQLKAAFISGFMTALMVTMGVAIWQLIDAPGVLAHWTLLISAGAPMGFFVYVFVGNVARTGRNLWWMPAVGAVCSGLALATGAMPSALASAVVCVLLPLIYIHWYSRFGDRSSAILAVGKPLPNLPLQTLDGQTVSSHSMMSTPALWVFFRGNWCPLCMAQIKEVAAQYRALADRGVQVLLVSPQAEANSVALAKKFDAPMTFLKDTDNRAAKALGILDKGGLPMGMQALGYDSDVPMPTVLITDAGGQIVYCDLTDNYRIRPDPAEFLAAIGRLGVA